MPKVLCGTLACYMIQLMTQDAQSRFPGMENNSPFIPRVRYTMICWDLCMLTLTFIIASPFTVLLIFFHFLG